jgi:O-antigen/teichoic acid export membrane protein
MSNSTIVKNSLILYVRLVVTSLLGIITSRLLLNALGVNDFGLYAVVGGVVLMMNFLNTVLISTSFRFIAFALGKQDNKSVNEIFNISLILHCILAIALLVIAETLGVFYINNYLNVEPERLTDALVVFRLSTFAALFSVVSIPFQGLLTAKENFLVRSGIEISIASAKFVAVLLLLNYSGDKLLYYAQCMLVASALGPLLFVVYTKLKYRVLTVFKFSKNWTIYKEFFSFSTWIMFGAAASIGKVQGTALIINAFFGTVLNASFGLANQLNTFVMMFSSNVGAAIIPQITKSYSAGEFERTKDLTVMSSKISFFLMLFIAVPFLLFTEVLLELWLYNIPEYVIIFSQLMIINALVDSCSSGIPAAIQASGKIKYYQIFSSSNLLVSLPIAYLFFSKGYPPTTIILIFIGASIINSLLGQVFLKRALNFDILDYFNRVYKRVFYVLLLISPLYLLSEFFDKDLWSLGTFIILSSITIIFAVYFVGLSLSERDYVKSGLIKFKSKFSR